MERVRLRFYDPIERYTGVVQAGCNLYAWRSPCSAVASCLSYALVEAIDYICFYHFSIRSMAYWGDSE